MPAKATATPRSLIVAGALMALIQPSVWGEATAPAHHDPAGHDNHEDAAQEDGWHRLQDWVIGVLGGVHPHATDHDTQGHLEPLAVTLFSDQTELFAELPPLVVGETAEFLVHLTRLADFKAIEVGEVRVTLTGGDTPDETFIAPSPSRPGLFRVAVAPSAAGERRVRITLASLDIQDTHDLGNLPVYPNHLAAEPAAGEDVGEESGVVLLKEQQWRSDFATAVATPRLLRGSVPATG
ncbi:MAG: hypothetical protein KAX51_09380, partial [Chromatiaceae bacterium]|nr:hypothetical protein [Chromatiaceae bacterium]